MTWFGVAVFMACVGVVGVTTTGWAGFDVTNGGTAVCVGADLETAGVDAGKSNFCIWKENI